MSVNQKPPGRGSAPGTPRWVKLMAIIFILLILLVVVLHLMGFGFGSHGAVGALPGDIVSCMWLIGRSVQQT